MSDYPLISCICPTANRGVFLEQAIKLFKAQDYPNKELVIFEDGNEFNWKMALGHNYHYVSGSMSIGEKRNRACMWTRLDCQLLCHWDDDDYFGPRRLSVQAAPILAGRADVTALRMEAVLDLETFQAWTCSDQVHASLFFKDVRAGTLMYPASYFDEGARYPDSSSGEDVAFLRQLLHREARLEQIRSPQSYTCIRHAGSTSAGLSTDGWEQIALDTAIPQTEQPFYQQFKPIIAGGNR